MSVGGGGRGVRSEGEGWYVCWLLNVPATCECFSDNFTCCHTEIKIKLSTSPSHSILTPGRPVPALTLERQAPGRVATGVPIFESLE